MAIQEAANKRARSQSLARIIGILVAVAVVCGLLACAYSTNLFHIKRLLGVEIDPQTDYSAYLTDEGKIENVNTSDYVGTFDVASVTLDEADVTYTDEQLESHIESLLDSNKTDDGETGTFDDTFVQTYLTDSGYTTAEEYKAGYRAEQEQALYKDAIDTWIEENVSLGSYPKEYLRQLKGLQMTEDETSFTQSKAMYDAFGMSFDYEDYQDFYKTDDQTYEEVRDGKAEVKATKALVYQNVFENAGLEITDDDYQAYLEANSIDDNDVETNGKPYYMQQLLQEKAAEYMQSHVTVTETAADTADEATTETAAE